MKAMCTPGARVSFKRFLIHLSCAWYQPSNFHGIQSSEQAYIFFDDGIKPVSLLFLEL
jgi:hypothetical protein